MRESREIAPGCSNCLENLPPLSSLWELRQRGLKRWFDTPSFGLPLITRSSATVRSISQGSQLKQGSVAGRWGEY